LTLRQKRRSTARASPENWPIAKSATRLSARSTSSREILPAVQPKMGRDRRFQAILLSAARFSTSKSALAEDFAKPGSWSDGRRSRLRIGVENFNLAKLRYHKNHHHD